MASVVVWLLRFHHSLQTDEMLERIQSVKDMFTRSSQAEVASNDVLKESKDWFFSHFADKLKFKSFANDQKMIEHLKDNHDATKLYMLITLIQSDCVKLLGTLDGFFSASCSCCLVQLPIKTLFFRKCRAGNRSA
jgi:hypothetical protein